MLDDVTAYNATIWIGNDITFDIDGGGRVRLDGCSVQLDRSRVYDECGKSFNLEIVLTSYQITVT